MSCNIYVLELEDKRFFVHSILSNNGLYPRQQSQFDSISSNINEVLRTCSSLYDYVNKYRPIQIVETIYSADPLQIDRFVLSYMIKYGIENVRGGSYSELVLPDYMAKSAETQIAVMSTMTGEVSAMIDELVVCSAESLAKEVAEFDKYEVLREHFISLVGNVLDYDMVRDDLIWLECLIEENKWRPIRSVAQKTEIFNRYSRLIEFLKALPGLYDKMARFKRDNGEPECIYFDTKGLYFKNPEFIFDSVVLHSGKTSDWLIHYREVEHMFYILFNWVKEAEFELNSKPADWAQCIKMKKRYLAYTYE